MIPLNDTKFKWKREREKSRRRILIQACIRSFIEIFMAIQKFAKLKINAITHRMVREGKQMPWAKCGNIIKQVERKSFILLANYSFMSRRLLLMEFCPPRKEQEIERETWIETKVSIFRYIWLEILSENVLFQKLSSLHSCFDAVVGAVAKPKNVQFAWQQPKSRA